MHLLRVAFRNLLRNGRRTAICASAIVVSTAMLILMFSLLDGSGRSLARKATEFALGEAQLHADGFLRDRSIYQQVSGGDGVLHRLREAGLHAAPRALGFGLLSSGPRSAGVQVWGVDPAAEREVGRIPEHLARGSWLPAAAERKAVLGEGLARTLGVDVGSEVVVVVQAADGSVGNDVLRIAGVLRPIGSTLDRGTLLVDRRDWEPLFSQEGALHEVVVSSRGALPLERVVAAARNAAPGLDVRGWEQLAPGVVNLIAMWDVARWIASAIFLVAAGLGVLNTLLMSTYERIPEFGLVRALGASPARVVLDVAAEAFALGLIGSAGGAVLGLAVAWYATVVGIDLQAVSRTDLSFGGVAMDTVWRAHLTPTAVVAPVIEMWGMAIVAALYPAIRAVRWDPVRAIHHV